MPKPTKEFLKEVATDFYNKWKFPNCCGSIDGKHCRIKNPQDGGSSFFNYKKYFSIVIQAVADANRRFLVIEVGGRGNQSDGGTFQASELYQLLESENFMPDDKILPNSNYVLPHILIGDEAYPLKKYLMRPFPRNSLNDEKSIINERLSMARKTIECAFGITSMKWRVLTKAMECSVSNANLIVMTCCLLHNIVTDKDNLSMQDLNFISQGQSPASRRNNHSSVIATTIREKFMDYFVSNP